MPKVTINYFAALREQAAKDIETYETKVKSAGELYGELQAKYDLTLNEDQIRVSVNDRFEAMDYPLSSGDRVVFIPPVSGG